MTDRERTELEFRLLDKRLRESKTAWVGIGTIGLLYALAWGVIWRGFGEWIGIACVVCIGFVGVSFIWGTKRAEGMTRAAFFGRPSATIPIAPPPPLEAPEIPAGEPVVDGGTVPD